MIGALILAAASASPASLAVFQPLVGHCWVTKLSEDMTDRHCFQLRFGGAHVSDDHVVTRNGHQVYAGLTIYSLDGGSIVLSYFNSLGGVGHGGAEASGDQIRFHLTMRASPDSKPQQFEPRWTLYEDGYEVVSASGTQRFRLDDR